jgi:hypothetical protein
MPKDLRLFFASVHHFGGESKQLLKVVLSVVPEELVALKRGCYEERTAALCITCVMHEAHYFAQAPQVNTAAIAGV